MYSSSQRLMRSQTDKMIAGVAGGIGQYLGIDPVFVRLAFVALLFTGVGVLLYPVLWLVMPLEGSTGAQPNQAFNEMRNQAMRVGEEIRDVFVAPNSAPRRPRYDPMTGQPIDPEDVPINNIPNTPSAEDVRSRRNRLLGFALLAVGGFILLTMMPVVGHIAGRFLFPAILIAAGVFVLRRGSN